MADNGSNNDDNADQAAIDAVLVEIDFPASRDDLVAGARDADADPAVVVLLQSLPDEEYETRSDVDRAITNLGTDGGGGGDGNQERSDR
jgi:hypothetical protein